MRENDLDSIRLLLATAKMLAGRLERLSADSPWAHRASGLRGSLLREIEAAQAHLEGEKPETSSHERLGRLVTAGFDILEQAAREIRPPEDDEQGS